MVPSRPPSPSLLRHWGRFDTSHPPADKNSAENLCVYGSSLVCRKDREKYYWPLKKIVRGPVGELRHWTRLLTNGQQVHRTIPGRTGRAWCPAASLPGDSPGVRLASDVWSVGILTLELLTGTPGWDDAVRQGPDAQRLANEGDGGALERGGGEEAAASL